MTTPPPTTPSWTRRTASVTGTPPSTAASAVRSEESEFVSGTHCGCVTGKTLLAGDNKGTVTLLTTEGEKVWEKRLHTKKVLNLQFSPREPYIFVSASVDNVAKVKNYTMYHLIK